MHLIPIPIPWLILLLFPIQSSPFPCTPLIRTWPNTRTDTGEGRYTSPLTLLICEYRYITLMFLNFFCSTSNQIFKKFPQESMPQAPLIHDLLFLPISTIVWSELTCCNSLSHSRLACSRLSAHIEPSVNNPRRQTRPIHDHELS